MKALTIEQMKLLADKGFSITEVIAFAEMGAVKSKAAERTARWRARKAGSVTQSVTGDGHSDASPPPKEDHTPPVSSNDETRPVRKSRSQQGTPAKPDDVEDRVWADFVKHRQKKGGVTETAVDGIRREAEAAGWTLNNALAEIVTRNWQGFKAKWALDKPPDPGGTSNDYLATMLAKQAATA